MKKTYLFFVLICFAQIVFGQATTLSLDECRKLALEHNKGAQISEANVEMADALAKAAKAQFLPSIGFTGTYLRTNNELQLLSEDKLLPVGIKMADGSFGFDASNVNNKWTLVNGQPVPLDANGNPFNPKTDPSKIEWKNYAYLPAEETKVERNNYLIGAVSLIQPVYMGGKIRELNKIAQYAKNVAETKKKMDDSDVLYNVDEAYWRVVSLQEKVRLSQDYSNLITKLNSDVEEMYKEGVATRNDVLKVKVKVNEADLNLSKAQDGLRLSQMALCQEIGLPLDSEIALSDTPNPTMNSVKDTGYADYALSHRNEIVALDISTKVAESGVKVMKSRFMPNVALTANYLASNPNPYNGFEKEFGFDWNVGVVVNVPIFHWGERHQTLRAAKVNKRVAELKMEDAKEKISLQVSQAMFKVNESNRRVLMTQQNIEKAEENLKVATDGFKEGMLSTTDVLEAQTLWQSAISENIDARMDAMLSGTNLKKVLGELK